MKDTNDYGSFADIPRNQTLVVVEGDFEKKTVLNLLCNCFPKLNIQKENIHVYGAKIYDLYHLIEVEYGGDWFEQDVDIDIPLLISRREGISPVLDQRKFTNIYLIFDYEHHDILYSDEKIERMQRHFGSASDDGMLYINYPMIESFIDVKSFAEEEYFQKHISVCCQPGRCYKQLAQNNSIIYEYINVYKKIIEELKRQVCDISIEDLTREVCTLPNADQRREQIYNRLIEADFNEKSAMELSYSLDAKLGKVLYTEQTSYWDKLTEMMMWVARQNIAKAWMIQTGYKSISNLKECYEKINWSQILEKQNTVSRDPNDGIIWGLCTCITFLGEYKFFWNID